MNTRERVKTIAELQLKDWLDLKQSKLLANIASHIAFADVMLLL